ncbi:HipA domain-containing protein [Rheinheimera sp. KL1]|uniref:HipA domain-containing protein n=1 Tax=Rheinheimera sp. KL1 TaxID=1635005 RepID=UPI0033659785
MRPKRKSLKTSYGYPALAEILRHYSSGSSDSEDLYRRMLLNLLIGNTDDHSRSILVRPECQLRTLKC